MSGLEIQHVLDLIESSIHANMDSVRDEILHYLQENSDQLAAEVLKNGYAIIPTHLGPVRISEDDLKASEGDRKAQYA